MNKQNMYVVVFVATLLFVSCAATIEIRPGGAVITAPMFEACDGVTFHLIARQSGKPTVDVDGTISGGRLEFSSRALREFDFTRAVTLEMRVTSRPGPDCRFEYMALYYTDPEILSPAGDNRYSIDGDKFKKM